MSNKEDIKQMIRLLKNMDSRLTAIEVGQEPMKEQKDFKLSPSSQICQKVRKDLETKQLVRLSDYGMGAVLKWARLELSKDKSLRVIYQAFDTYIIKETMQKTPCLVVVGEDKTRKKALNNKIEKVLVKLDKGKVLTSAKVGRILHITPQASNKYMEIIGRMEGYKLIKVGGHNKKFISKEGVEPKLAKHEPYMRKKSTYNKFMAEKLAFYQKQGGMNEHDAFMSAVADWNKRGAVPQTSPEPFQAFQSIKSELHSILIGVLERLFKNGVAIDFKSISYVLDIQKQSEYNDLITDIIRNESALKHYFNVPNGRLVWNGQTLRYEA